MFPRLFATWMLFLLFLQWGSSRQERSRFRRWPSTDCLSGCLVEQAVDGGSQQSINVQVAVVVAKVFLQEVFADQGNAVTSGGRSPRLCYRVVIISS